MSALLYDRDCGFCRWCTSVLLAWDRRRLLRPVAIQSAEGARLLADLEGPARLASWHLVDRGGRRHSGAAALGPLMNHLPLGAPLGALARAFPSTADRAYRAVAAHRSRLGRLIGAGARSRADRRIGDRTRD